LALTGFGLLACAALENPDMPRIEEYFSGPAKHLVASEPEELSKGEQKEGPVSEKAEKRPLTLDICVRIAFNKGPLNRTAQKGIVAVEESG